MAYLDLYQFSEHGVSLDASCSQLLNSQNFTLILARSLKKKKGICTGISNDREFVCFADSSCFMVSQQNIRKHKWQLRLFMFYV